MARLDWKGDEVAAKYVTASRLAIDQTTGAAVNHAKQNHEFANISGTLEGSLRIEPAQLEGMDVVGRWGSFDVVYAIFMELLAGETAGDVHRQGTGGHPFLRPAADAEYPSLPARIRASLEGLP